MIIAFQSFSQRNDLNVIAYYMGGPEKVNAIPAEKLTHIIFSFCHLRGNSLAVDDSADSIAIKDLVSLKARNPQLKVMLALGGWGGCKTCSDVFSTVQGRSEFAQSVLEMSRYFMTDGIDLDWEYPAIEGFPDHPYKPEDRDNFTLLTETLRHTLGDRYEISFAAGGFEEYLEGSVDWEAVMKNVNRVHLMSYDLVHGNSTVTGHHTPLFSTPMQEASAHKAIRYLTRKGVPKSKIVIGAAFYARMWERVEAFNDGLYQPGKFKASVPYNHFSSEITKEGGFEFFWDETALAPYAYNTKQKLFVTYDDKRSIGEKTKYAIDQKLNGIMFWELTHDVETGGLLDTINSLKQPGIGKSK